MAYAAYLLSAALQYKTPLAVASRNQTFVQTSSAPRPGSNPPSNALLRRAVMIPKSLMDRARSPSGRGSVVQSDETIPNAARRIPTECIVLSALKAAQHDLVFLGGCTHTDRPDLPLSPTTSWKTDVSATLAAINAAIAAVDGNGRRTDPGCARCNSCQPTEPDTDPSTSGGERGGSRKPDGDRL